MDAIDKTAALAKLRQLLKSYNQAELKDPPTSEETARNPALALKGDELMTKSELADEVLEEIEKREKDAWFAFSESMKTLRTHYSA